MAVTPRASSAIACAAAQAAHPTGPCVAPMLLPFLFILYITNYLDRTSEAYAALEISPDDLGLSRRA